MVKVYVFDVDECMSCSNGPVTPEMLKQLKDKGEIVGICGNLTPFCQKIPKWWDYVSLLMNYDFGHPEMKQFQFYNVPKACYMYSFQHIAYPFADEYIMVGNVFGEKNSLGVVCGSHDSESAAQAGWRFIKEDSFAAGER